MKTYEMQFSGRKLTEHGKFYPIRTQRFADSAEAAVEALSDQFERGPGPAPTVKEIATPFDVEYLHRSVVNDRTTAEAIQRHVSGIVSAISRRRDGLARENKAWHDDAEAPDHALYHAPAEAQMPAELVMEAAAEAVLYYLRETPAGLKVWDRLQLAKDGTRSTAQLIVEVKGGCVVDVRGLAPGQTYTLLDRDTLEEEPGTGCDGAGPHAAGEIRKLPVAQGNPHLGNMLLCRSCFDLEIAFRVERNTELAKGCQFDLPEWASLEVYQ